MTGGAALGGAAPADAGLPRERTSLSWNRTSLSVIVVALLVVRDGFAADQPFFVYTGAALLVAAAALMLYASRRSFEVTRHRGFAGIAALATLACVAGLASILL